MCPHDRGAVLDVKTYGVNNSWPAKNLHLLLDMHLYACDLDLPGIGARSSFQPIIRLVDPAVVALAIHHVLG